MVQSKKLFSLPNSKEYMLTRKSSSALNAENTPERLEHNFEVFFNTIDELLFVLDEQGRILHANDTVIKRLGYTREELVGQSVLIVHPPERREEAAQITQNMLAGKAEFCPVPVQTRDGVQIPVETRVKMGEWNGKQVLFGVSKDISRLKLSEEKFSKAFHSNAALMALSQAQSGAFIDVNEAFLQTLGYSREDVIGHSARELGIFIDPDIRNKILMLETNGQIRNIELQVRTKSGQVLYGLFSADRLYVGDTPCLLTVMTDITDRKANEERERKGREFAEALHDIALALNGTLELDQVFDRILENLKRVLECDSANIMLIKEGKVRTIRSMRIYIADEFPITQAPVLEQMAQNSTSVVIPNVDQHPDWRLMPGTEWIKSYMGAPIIIKNEVIGFINLDSATAGFYSNGQMERLRAFADQAAIAVQNARLYAKVTELATIDTLTGLYNRGHFHELSNREIARARRYHTPLSVVMFDLDRYKQVNDRYGHQAGDKVLVEISNLCRSNLRNVDIACRYGGDEITIVLPNTNLEQATLFAERLRSLISETRILAGQKIIQITASIGVASFHSGISSLEDLLANADRALYWAKQKRNQIAIFPNNGEE
jgi:diguanylate cyclase (GGDEF)-like protein/PAS domain S-box-containing protein